MPATRNTLPDLPVTSQEGPFLTASLKVPLGLRHFRSHGPCSAPVTSETFLILSLARCVPTHGHGLLVGETPREPLLVRL